MDWLHCPGGNATDPIWRVLASSDRISRWIPLKPQHTNPNPNRLANQLWCYWLPYSSHTTQHPSQTPCLPWISYATQNLMLDPCKMIQKAVWNISYVSVSFFPSLKLNFIVYRSSKVSHVQIAFLKFTSCDNLTLVGCIRIPAVAVHLNLKS